MIANDKVVTIEYTVTDENNQVLDSSEGREPLKYLHGAGNIIPGLESALAGLKAGDEYEVEVAPADAYGEHNPQLVQDVPRAAFEGVDQIEPGMVFNAQGPQGQVQVTVTGVAEDTVTIDGNHPLAGKTLTFKGNVVDVRDATEEEVQHGHAH